MNENLNYKNEFYIINKDDYSIIIDLLFRKCSRVE